MDHIYNVIDNDYPGKGLIRLISWCRRGGIKDLLMKKIGCKGVVVVEY